MKRLCTALCVFLCVLMFAAAALADTYVNGYTRKDGTYVKPHWRSDANGTKSDNWSTKGNINPHTGKEGTRTYGGTFGSIDGKKKKSTSLWDY